MLPLEVTPLPQPSLHAMTQQNKWTCTEQPYRFALLPELHMPACWPMCVMHPTKQVHVPRGWLIACLSIT